MLANPLLMSPCYDFLGMSGFEPKELAVSSRRATQPPIRLPVPNQPSFYLATYPSTKLPIPLPSHPSITERSIPLLGHPSIYLANHPLLATYPSA